ncbi:hypothetical protein [Psychrobacter sp. I-STPA6b]|uniref:hypothetical protein n=1 Tax=Psychrobacter sp. I-STPA6b TaxID=2585718 RepID=UPI001D0C22AE|nr:hypothetical protein [Psychrobacter sp. I-STPA6b]
MQTVVLNIQDNAVEKVMALLNKLPKEEVTISQGSYNLRYQDSNYQDGDITTKPDFYQNLMQWREDNQQLLVDDDPWADVRSKEEGREFNWDDM